MNLRTIILDHLRAHGPAYTVAVVNAVSRAAGRVASFNAIHRVLRRFAAEGVVRCVRLPVQTAAGETTAEGWEVAQ